MIIISRSNSLLNAVLIPTIHRITKVRVKCRQQATEIAVAAVQRAALTARLCDDEDIEPRAQRSLG